MTMGHTEFVGSGRYYSLGGKFLCDDKRYVAPHDVSMRRLSPIYISALLVYVYSVVSGIL